MEESARERVVEYQWREPVTLAMALEAASLLGVDLDDLFAKPDLARKRLPLDHLQAFMTCVLGDAPDLNRMALAMAEEMAGAVAAAFFFDVYQARRTAPAAYFASSTSPRSVMLTPSRGLRAQRSP